MTRITRLEVITDTGRDYVCWEEDNDITVSYQDDGRTLKVFVNKVEPKSPAEAENLACMFGEGPDDVSFKIQHITKHYDKLDTFVRNNDR